MYAVSERIRDEWTIGLVLHKTIGEAFSEATLMLIERYKHDHNKLIKVLTEFINNEGHWSDEENGDDYCIDIDEIDFGEHREF